MAPRLPTEPPRGMRDILPAEAELRDAAAGTILAVYRRYGFRRIETPALESLQLLTGGGGGENEKLIFKVLKRGEKLDLAAAASEADLADLGLRFDLTVPLARYYAHNHAKLPEPLKAVQIGPVWRAERPQQGRYRQFTQCDIDILGVASEIAEIELILATTEALGALGLDGPDRADQRPAPPGRHGRLVRLRPGAAARASSSRSTSWDKLAPDEVAPGADAGRPPGGRHRPHAGALQSARRAARPGRAASALLGARARTRAFAALRAYRRHRARRGGRPLPDRRSTRRWCGAWATTPGPIFEIAAASFGAGVDRRGRALRRHGRQAPRPGRPRHRVLDRLRARRGHSRQAAERPASRNGERDRAALRRGGAGPRARCCGLARELRAAGHLVALERQTRSPGAQRAALEKQGYDGVATVSARGPRRACSGLPSARRARPGSRA